MIAIIVDHPKRELPFVVKLAEEFLKRFNEVILIPMYEIDDFLLSRKFKETKLIIFNYIRKNNLDKIEYSHLSGKINVIYDTEGAPGRDGYDLSNFLNRVKNYFNLIDLYLFWGQAQVEDIKKKINLNFDFNVVGFLRHLEKNNSQDKKENILINTNFASINPMFSNSVKEEIKIFKNLKDVKNIDFYERILEKKKEKEELFDFIKYISNKLPKEKFYIRPHPFEEKIDYMNLSNNIKNVFIDTSLTSIEALRNSKALIHLGCTTSVEAYFLNVPVINLSWINKNSKYSYSVVKRNGFQANNLEEVCDFLNRINDKENFDQDQIYDVKNINDFFGNRKNNLDSFISYILTVLNKKNKKKIFKPRLSLKAYLKYFSKIILPGKIQRFIYTIYFGKKVYESRKNKYFQKELILRYSSKSLNIKKISDFYIIKKNV